MKRRLALFLVLLLCLIAVLPAQSAVTKLDLSIDGESVLYASYEPAAITAKVYDDELGYLEREVGWGLTNPEAGTLVGDVYRATFTPAESLGPGRWDSVSTTIYAVYEGIKGELPLKIYPLEAKDNALKKIMVYLRSQQRDDGFLNDWVMTGLAAAGENPVGTDWQKQGVSHLVYMENYIKELKDKDNLGVYFKQLTDYERLLISVAAAAYGDEAWQVKLNDFGGVNLVEKICVAQDVYGHFGKDAESSLVTSHVWAILALKAAGKEVPNSQAAVDWLVYHQNSDGGWGYTIDLADPWRGYLSDSNSTADVIRALVALGETDKSKDSPLGKALAFLKTAQNPDGGFVYNRAWETPDWPAISDSCSDARVMIALTAAGEDPQGEKWSQNGNNALTHLLSLQQPNGSFLYQPGSPWGVQLSFYADAVLALAGKQLPTVLPVSPPPGNGGGISPQTITVTIEVLGLDGVPMYAARQVTLGSGEQTALGALQKLGTQITFSEAYGTAYVTGIDGLMEKQYGPTSGWSYKVNDQVPPVPARDYTLKNGDRVTWFYVRSVEETGSGGRTLLAPVLPGKKFGAQVYEKLDMLAELLPKGTLPIEQVADRIIILDEKKGLSEQEKEKLKQELTKNTVSLSERVKPGDERVIADQLYEAGIEIVKDSIDKESTITVQEVNMEKVREIPFPSFYYLASGVYDFGPDGLVFKKPAIIFLRFIPEEDVDLKQFTLAYFNSKESIWVPVPAVLDLSTFTVLAKVEHFSRYAVLMREKGKTLSLFVDLTGFDWAEKAIEKLSRQGIVTGTDPGRFEPGRPVTRGECAAMIGRALGLKAGLEKDSQIFSDVAAARWYAPWVASVKQAGIFLGYPDGTFCPERKISRQEMAVAIVKAREYQRKKALQSGGKRTFRDAEKIASWARPFVKIAVEQQLMIGFPDNSFNPLGMINRAQAAVTVYRLLQ